MKTEYVEGDYFAGGCSHSFDYSKYNFMLLRQSANGGEKIYFYKSELEKVGRKIECGDIIINPSYSILYVRVKKDLKLLKDWKYCYCALVRED